MNINLLTNAHEGLNDEQLEAVQHILSGWQGQNGRIRLTIIDGPPGTGKTHIASIAAGRWITNRSRQVVILTPTHQAAQRAQELLLNVGFDIHEAVCLRPGALNVQPGVITFENVAYLPDSVRRQLSQAQVFITTWHGAQRALQLVSSGFLLILDEVSQIPYSAFLALVSRIGRSNTPTPGGFSLIGDPHQLPVITTQDSLAINASLGILGRHPYCTPHLLTIQHRMNETICNIVNELRRVGFGGVPLQPANQHVANNTLEQVTGYYNAMNDLHEVIDPDYPVVFVDTGRFSTELKLTEEAVAGSWAYEAEAQLALKLANQIQESYQLPLNKLAVLSAYKAHAALMHQIGIQNARTIYRAQGREWDCVILSLGRTNIPRRTILNEVYQHMYVGLSRARTKLIVLLNVAAFNQFRLFGPLIAALPRITGARLVQVDPNWR